GQTASPSWALTMMRRSRLLGFIGDAFDAMLRLGAKPRPTVASPAHSSNPSSAARWIDYAWYALLLLVGVGAVTKTMSFVLREVRPGEIGHVVGLGFITLARVAVLIALASVIWVPIGVWVGLRPRVTRIVQPIAQFLAAFPANLLFPIVVSAVVMLKLVPDI